MAATKVGSRRLAKRRKPSAAGAGARGHSRARGAHLGKHRRDLVGIGLLFLGILTGLGIYADMAGPAGRGLEWLGRFILGSSAVAIPPALAAIGFTVLSDRDPLAPGRIAIGSTLAAAGVGAMRHLLQADDTAGLRLDEIPRLGGAVGAAVAWPLERLLSVWGAGSLIVVMTFMGLLITTRTPISRVLGWIRAGLKGLGSGIALFAARAKPGFAALAAKLKSLRPPSRERQESAPPIDKQVRQRRSRKKRPVAEGAQSDEPDESEAEPVTAPPPTASGGAGGYRIPPLDLLKTSSSAEISQKAIDDTIAILERTLQEFLVDARVTGFTSGPTVTRYEVEVGAGVKVNRVVGLQNEIRYALASGEIRILAPIPGRSAIGIEVPNRDRHQVTLGDVLRSEEARNAKHPLTVGLGKSISGQPVMVDLSEMPHLLIAGATGSGKSTCINAMLISILARTRPDQVRLLLIDPKLVELSNYNGVPHLLTPVVTSAKKAAEALGWVAREMDARYEVLATVGMRNSDLYNEACRAGALGDFDDGTPRSPFPYYVVVIDELADLMMVAPREVEDYICRIAQKARAVGIHLVVATQRPSVDVVTGVIKANIPSRLAFSTASMQDSRVILDEGGADRLIGKGDMLYRHASAGRPQRLQGALVSESEVNALVGWCRRQREVNYVEGIVSEKGQTSLSLYNDEDDDETLLVQAMELIVRSQLGSTSMLQRKLRVGFARAGRLMDLLEQRGVVGPSHGSKPREVLMGIDEYDLLSEPARSGAPD